MRRRSLASCLAGLLASGCGLLLDLAPPDPQSSFDASTPPPRDGGAGADGAMDAGMHAEDASTDGGPGPCAENGARCPLGDREGICVAGVCAPSRCGDGVRDPRTEDCDDGNTIDDDACPSDCAFECMLASDCPIAVGPCLGAVGCVEGRCVQPPLDEGTPCSNGGEEGTCRGGLCAALLCGNDSLDIGEQCDDGNDVTGDGCEADCTFTCEADADCDDGRFCTGVERCESGSHTCRSTPVSCGAPDACRASHCDTVTDGCVTVSVDRDLDGFVCPEDCAPGDMSIHPGAPERCNAADDDCDGAIDDGLGTVLCFADADRDGFGVAGFGVDRCACLPGEAAVAGDCYDDASDPIASMVNPGAAMFRPDSYTPGAFRTWDWNCDGDQEIAFDRTVDITGVPPPCDLPTSPGVCRRDPVWESDAIPFCGGTSSAYICALVAGVCVRQHVEEQPQLCR